MKTARPTPPGHGTQYQCRASSSTTPLTTSPRMAIHSVGQAYPPKLSPKLSPGAVSITRRTPGATLQESKTSSSPSYFEIVVDSTPDTREQATAARDNWSSPSPSVKSFSAAISKQALPLDANPVYEAFRRQADVNHFSRSFSLGTPQLDSIPSVSCVSPARPQPPRRITQDSHASVSNYRIAASAHAHNTILPRGSNYDGSRPASSQMDVDGDTNSMHDSAYVSSDSKRNSEASLDPPFFSNAPRFESPNQLDASSDSRPSVPEQHSNEHKHPSFPMSFGRLSMPVVKTGTFGIGPTPLRAETAPLKNDSTANMLSAKQLKEIMDLDYVTTSSGGAPKLLLLDIRVSTYFSVSRIRGALNMCIPTTLLKRATFNLEKMQLYFANQNDQTLFSSWRDVDHLVVYDNNSSEKRDASAAMNMLRKFTNEGYKGHACILRGGFKAFADTYPNLVDCESISPPSSGPVSTLSLDPSAPRRLSIAPVIGGVVLPSAKTGANPFFANIRQNMDLADGVGCIELNLPSGVSAASFPTWLREAADPADHGSKVSNRFLEIELAEQARMKHAYGVVNPPTQTTDACGKVQICGVEMGVKNRYKDVLPFEHARVRLQGPDRVDCDYVNASHVRASRSNKRYIASQAPLPDTFSDFWSMIWGEDVRVIVMLTAEAEGGQIKCHPYWKNSEYGNLTLCLVSETKVSLDVDKYRSNSCIAGSVASMASASDSYAQASPEHGRRRAHTMVSIEDSDGGPLSVAQQSQAQAGETPFVYIRKFALSHRGHPSVPIREVTQLHYASWPDFGTPAQPSHLLALIELANVMQRAASPVDSPKGMDKAEKSPAGQATAGIRGSPSSRKLDHVLWPTYDEPESSRDPRPMLVHCSAGCGRTGTFCTVDSVVDMLKRQNQRSVRRTNALAEQYQNGSARRDSNLAPDDVAMGDGDIKMSGTDGAQSTASAPGDDDGFDQTWLDGDLVDLVAGTVEDFRTQRLSMVQTLRQYVLCYETIAEWLSKMQQRQSGTFRGLGRTRSESMRMTLG